jgi:hypothetical protein
MTTIDDFGDVGAPLTTLGGPTGWAAAVRDAITALEGSAAPEGGTTGQVLAKASATNFDTEWVDPGGGGGGTPIDYAYRTAGNVSVTTSWADVDTATDLSIAAVAGDVLEIGVSGAWSTGSGAGDYSLLQVQVRANGSFVRSIGPVSPDDAADGNIPMVWFAQGTTYQIPVSGSVLTVVESDDLYSSAVALRLRAVSSPARALNATTAAPFLWWVKNLGQ